VFGDGIRTLCYVDDLIEGMMRMRGEMIPLQRKPDISLAGEKLGAGSESGRGAEADHCLF